jgi:hypothetical protein
MIKTDVKKILSETNVPYITCTKGHTYHVPSKFFNRNVKKKRDFFCPTCLIAFKIMENVEKKKVT